MRVPPAIIASLSLAAAFGLAASPAVSASADHPVPHPFYETKPGPSVAARAAQAVQNAQASANTAASADGATVRPLVVRPEAPVQGRVIASTDAAPLTSPDFTAADAAAPPTAIGLGGASALGRNVVPNPGPGGGLVHTAPDLNTTRDEIAVTTVF